MTDFPCVSIVIPIYDVEEYISACLESVLCQSYRNIEVICVDDCGTDSSMAVVETFSSKDSRIKIIRHTQNQGLGPARNTGMSAASGAYVLFLDSDDMLYPDALERLVANAHHTSADVVAGRVIAFPHIDDDKLKTFASEYNKADSNAPSGIWQITLEEVPSACFQLSAVSHGRLFKKDFLTKNGLQFINQKVVHEDHGFLLKYFACLPTISITDIPTVHYRIRPNSIMTGLEGKAFSERSKVHMRLALDDARAYVFKRYDKAMATYLLYLLAKPAPVPFIYDFGRVFQLQWGIFEKLVRIFGCAVYKTRLTSTRRIEHSVCGIRLWKSPQLKASQISRKVLNA